MRVMVIDDDETILTISKRILTREGYDVVAVSNGEDGLNLLKQDDSGIDLVMLDWALPGLSGNETFNRIKQLDRELPILICSGQVVDRSEIRIDKNPNVGFLEKPFRTNELLTMIKQFIGE